jgi:hypothetical protein
MRAPLLLALMTLAAAPTAGQVAAHIAAGDSAYDGLRPQTALMHYEMAIVEDSTNYEALWKAGRAVADIAKQIQGDGDADRDRRDSLYAVGRVYAEAAVRANDGDPDGHYVLAMVLGRLSRTKGSKERVRFARVIFDEASRAVALDSTHDGAHHVLGAWHAEVKRLSGVQRFFAKTLFGGGFMGRASWEWATWHLESAVAFRPTNIYHRLELAEVLVDRERYSAAREQLTTIATLPIGDVLDPQYQREAAALLARVAGKRDKS